MRSVYVADVVCCNTVSGSSLENKTAVLKVIFDE